jgi:5'-3' exonuclease
VALLTKYKTIDGVLKHHELSPSDKESAKMSHDLATIRTNVPLEGSLTPFGSLNRPEVVHELTKLGFRTLLKRITGEEINNIKEKKQEKQKDTNVQQQLL